MSAHSADSAPGLNGGPDPSGAPDDELFFVVPDGVDDEERVSGGNVYDRRVRDILSDRGRVVRQVATLQDARAIAGALRGIPSGALVLIDGLIAVSAADVLAIESARLRLVVLAHTVLSLLPPTPADTHGADPFERVAQERLALRAARLVIATSDWTREELAEQGLAEPDRVVVARPGIDRPAIAAAGRSIDGGRLLCVGVVAPHKGQDLLVQALAGLADLPGWTCTIAGSLDADPAFVFALERQLAAAGISDRVTFTGVLAADRLERAYAHAELLVAPSRVEAYGMAAAGAIARGIPVLAARVGGLPEAVGAEPVGAEPVGPGAAASILIPPDDAWALRLALHLWLTAPELRAATTRAAVAAAAGSRSWDDTATDLERALRSLAREEVTAA